MKPTAGIDVLLECLKYVALRYDRQIDSTTSLANLPVPAEGITPALFPRVAARAGFQASIFSKDFTRIEQQQQPVILLLRDNQVAIRFIRKGCSDAEYHQPCDDGSFRQISEAEVRAGFIGHGFTLTCVTRDSVTHSSADMELTEHRKKWFWLTLWRFRAYYLQILPASLLVNLFALTMPFFVMIVYDKVVPNNAVETLWVLALGACLVFLFDLTIRIVRGSLLEQAGREMDQELAGLLFEQLMALSYSALPSSTGTLANQVKSYDMLREFFISATMLALVDLPFSILMIGVIFMIAGPIGWLLVLAMLTGVILNALLQWPLHRSVKQSSASNLERQCLTAECISHLESIKASNSEGYFQRRMELLLTSASNSGVQSHWYALFGNSATTTLINLTSIAVIVTGVYHVNAGLLSMGGLIATVMLTSRCLAPMAMISGLMTRLQQTLQSLHSLNEVMAMGREVDHRKGYLLNNYFTPQYQFNEVELAYPGTSAPAISSTTLTFPANECIVLLGKIGCGKSSLVKLMAGIVSPTKGTLLVDGIDISQYHPSALRSRIGYVTQEPALFLGTLRDNITLGDTSITDETLMQTLTNVGLLDFVNAHSNGLNAEVGEQGRLLSGGQRRAVSLARCLVQNYALILLDEPTANLDPNTESTLLKALLEKRRKDNTSMVITTHRPAVVEIADRAIIMEKGKIIADGDPSIVLGTSGKPGKKKLRAKTTKTTAATA
ncbi:hypothetical protein AB833_07750 [Chromatiales bacterium (ex Bugula neritina AB1)]|nr:hypothetical protein AB833_07750 [Chromatiales bacterium (ex Bugula neritina AB1)]